MKKQRVSRILVVILGIFSAVPLCAAFADPLTLLENAQTRAQEARATNVCQNQMLQAMMSDEKYMEQDDSDPQKYMDAHKTELEKCKQDQINSMQKAQ